MHSVHLCEVRSLLQIPHATHDALKFLATVFVTLNKALLDLSPRGSGVRVHSGNYLIWLPRSRNAAPLASGLLNREAMNELTLSSIALILTLSLCLSHQSPDSKPS